MALVPLLWLGVLAYYRQPHSALWWAVALVLGISWIADTAAHWVDPWTVSRVYPLAQAGVLGLVLLPPAQLRRLVIVLAGAGLVAAQTTGPDLVTHTVAWSGIVLMLWQRRALVTIFAMMWLGWAAYTIAPAWWSWGVYQGLRAGGLGLFCWASAPVRVRA